MLQENNEPLIYIVLLNYNGVDHLRYCIPSILETDYGNYRLVVVDNASSDDSVAFVKTNYPSLKILEMKENHGWAGGNNKGIQYALDQGAEYIMLANNDILVHSSWLKSVQKAFQECQDAGFVGCSVYEPVQEDLYYEYNQACADWTGIEYRYTDKFISGMALAVRSSVFRCIGFIDEVFFIYGEETDLEVRGRKAGYRRVKTNVPVWHFGGGTLKKTRVKGAFLSIRNSIRLSIKHDSFFGVLFRMLKVLYICCFPFLRILHKGRVDSTILRMRTRNIFLNLFLFIGAVFWNCIHLLSTLKIKRNDYSKIEACVQKNKKCCINDR